MKIKRAILSDEYCRRKSTVALVFAIVHTCLAVIVVVGMACAMNRYPGHVHEGLPAVFGFIILAALAAGRHEQLKETQALMQKLSAGPNNIKQNPHK